MSNRYRIYKSYVEPCPLEYGPHFEWDQGCNGVIHVRCHYKVFWNGYGVVEHAEHEGFTELGACDHTCDSDEHDEHYGFLYDSPPPPISTVELTT